MSLGGDKHEPNNHYINHLTSFDSRKSTRDNLNLTAGALAARSFRSRSLIIKKTRKILIILQA
nr:MAG TPA: hypothetical protein [Caudoviricetes sp.]